METDPTAHAIGTAFSMGMVVLLSPEMFVLALLMAAHKSRARLNSVVFFLGSFIGLFAAIGIGLWITPSSTQSIHPASWTHFMIRSGIGTALLGLGIYRLWQFLKGEDDRKPKPKTTPPQWKSKLLRLFPLLGYRLRLLHRRTLPFQYISHRALYHWATSKDIDSRNRCWA